MQKHLDDELRRILGVKDEPDYFDERCARDFLRWKIAKWFVIVCFIALLGATIGAIYLSVRA